MSEPMKFAGKPFSGKTIGPLIAQVVESLNSGEAVRPMSAYTNMLRQEVDKHRLEIEDALRRISEKHIAELGKVDVKKANTDYPSEEKVKIAFLKEFDEVTAQFQDETAETLSSLPPDLAKQLTKDANSSIEHVKKSGLDQLNAVYRNGISAWIESLQESFQLKLTAAIEKLEKEELPLADEALQARLEVIFQSIVLSALTTNRVDATYRSKVEDCVTSLKKYFDLRGDICMKKNELQGQAQISKVREVIEEAMETMRGFVHSQSLMYRARPAGFLLKDLINDLNAKYQSVEEQLKKSIARLRPSLVTEAVGELETFCVEMSRQIDADFKNMLVDAYQTVTAGAISHLQKKVDMLQNLDTLEEEAHKITEEVFAEALNKLKDWTPSKYYAIIADNYFVDDYFLN